MTVLIASKISGLKNTLTAIVFTLAAYQAVVTEFEDANLDCDRFIQMHPCQVASGSLGRLIKADSWRTA